jgi:DNA-binding NtrC family response regulator
MRIIQARILIVDDESTKHSVLQDELSAAGYSVITAANPIEAARELTKSEFEVVVTDIRLPGKDGLSFLREVKKQNPTQAAIIMTTYWSAETAVEAMKLGIFDSLQKPFPPERLLLKLDKLLQYERIAAENKNLRRQLTTYRIEDQIIGQSRPIKDVLRQIYAATETEATVLIEGESGTGKELVAHILHENSDRAAGPFVEVACAAKPRNLLESELFGHEAGAFSGAMEHKQGRVELAHGGTLFLDDVDGIPLDTQAKLVPILREQVCERVGEERPISVNVRLIAATKRSLSSMVSEGSFREDLFSTLSSFSLKIPPLRERVEDIPLLVEYFLEKSGIKRNRERLIFSSEVLTMLQRHSWPGNVRELEHKIEMMVASGKKERRKKAEVSEHAASEDSETLFSLNMSGIERIDIGTVLEEVETRLLQWALDRARGKLTKAAEMLGLPRSTLQYKIKRQSTLADSLSYQI